MKKIGWPNAFEFAVATITFTIGLGVCFGFGIYISHWIVSGKFR